MPLRQSSDRPYVLLVMGIEGAYARHIVEGVIAYADRHGPWKLDLLLPHHLLDEGLRISVAGLRGIIAQVRREVTVDRLRSFGCPVVLAEQDHAEFPSVAVDDEAVGRLACEHFAQRGFRHLMYVGMPGSQYSDRREAGFRAEAQARGLAFHAWAMRPAEFAKPDETDDLMQSRIHELPKPLAILADNDIRGHWLLQRAVATGAVVPDQVAILGVDNDDIRCRTCTPALSSVDKGSRRIGFQAARLLDLLIAGCPPPSATRVVPPVRVVARQSTDTFATDNPLVRGAVRFIREQACEGATVDDTVRHVGSSRRTLEIAFKRETGRTLQQEITGARLANACRLLEETDMAMPEICARCAISYPSKLTQIFRRSLGVTPSEHRNRHRLGGDISR
jgi:LacI family transcriptional regulator, galactose operon repressor